MNARGSAKRGCEAVDGVGVWAGGDCDPPERGNCGAGAIREVRRRGKKQCVTQRRKAAKRNAFVFLAAWRLRERLWLRFGIVPGFRLGGVGVG